MTSDKEKQQLAKLGEDLRRLNAFLPNSMKTLDDALKKRFGPKGYERFKLFNSKYRELKSQGKDAEADDLFNKFVSSCE